MSCSISPSTGAGGRGRTHACYSTEFRRSGMSGVRLNAHRTTFLSARMLRGRARACIEFRCAFVETPRFRANLLCFASIQIIVKPQASRADKVAHRPERGSALARQHPSAHPAAAPPRDDAPLTRPLAIHMSFALIALPVPVRQLFTYSVP